MNKYNKALREERHNLYNPIKVYQQDSDLILGSMLNFSYGGACIISKDPIQKKKLLKLRLNYSNESHKINGIPVEVVCCWTKKSVIGDSYEIGLQFRDRSAKLSSDLTVLMNSYTNFVC
ncbi:MAG: PilZ domain-containing protein [Deltaproteobacteria bacterium]|nr:PilZ domain-containing protein [Deltaproteobacteria bacterium]